MANEGQQEGGARDGDPAPADGVGTAGRGSGQSEESAAHRGAPDLTRGAPETPAGDEAEAERARRREADLIGE